MKAAVLKKFGSPLDIEERAKPKPRGQEVLVKVKGAGVCHSDVHIMEGRHPNVSLPLILGHEISGEAEGLGDVLIYSSWGCKSCDLCSEGEEQLCSRATEAGWVRDGGYAEYVIVPSEKYLLPLEALDPIRAAPLADAGVTPYRAIRRIMQWLRGDCKAVVLGVGALGQFAVQYLRLLTKAHVIAVDLDDSKLRTALGLGANEVLRPSELTGPVDVVLNFVGQDSTLELATRVVKKGGIVMQVGEGGGHLVFGMFHVLHETYFTTSIWGSLRDLSTVLEYARHGKIRWSVETLPLDKANEALLRVKKGEVSGRLVLVP
jgi:propanol-preferring alcohol dehydrogenase